MPAEQDCVKYALQAQGKAAWQPYGATPGKRVDMPMGGDGAEPGFVGDTATSGAGVAGGIVGAGDAAKNAGIGWRLSQEEIDLRKGFIRESHKVNVVFTNGFHLISLNFKVITNVSSGQGMILFRHCKLIRRLAGRTLFITVIILVECKMELVIMIQRNFGLLSGNACKGLMLGDKVL